MSGFVDLRLSRGAGRPDESFWPSFTDIMAVVTMVFLITTSFLILRNLDLLRQITSTAEAERRAAELARSASAENATLEEQLANAQHTISMLRLEMLKLTEQRAELTDRLQRSERALVGSRAEAAELAERLSVNESSLGELAARLEAMSETLDAMQRERERLQAALNAGELSRRNLEQELGSARQARGDALAELESLRGQAAELTRERTELRATLAGAERELAAVRERSRGRERELSTLRERSQLAEAQIGDLQTQYGDLKARYDLLVRPARTAAGKYVVEVTYRKTAAGYQIRMRAPEDAEYRELGRAELERTLGELKQRLADSLYIKIIFPEDSGLSYDEAWTFTSQLLSRYDYYYRDGSAPTP